ncbi:unnamed protein product [Leptosia nina]|uniref:Uncharacterized protein n=1 Tax=Leptosia nina TaxID=320188 RepID=A0AAV1J7K8_9NEOP
MFMAGLRNDERVEDVTSSATASGLGGNFLRDLEMLHSLSSRLRTGYATDYDRHTRFESASLYLNGDGATEEQRSLEIGSSFTLWPWNPKKDSPGDFHREIWVMDVGILPIRNCGDVEAGQVQAQALTASPKYWGSEYRSSRPEGTRPPSVKRSFLLSTALRRRMRELYQRTLGQVVEVNVLRIVFALSRHRAISLALFHAKSEHDRFPSNQFTEGKKRVCFLVITFSSVGTPRGLTATITSRLSRAKPSLDSVTPIYPSPPLSLSTAICNRTAVMNRNRATDLFDSVYTDLICFGAPEGFHVTRRVVPEATLIKSYDINKMSSSANVWNEFREARSGIVLIKSLLSRGIMYMKMKQACTFIFLVSELYKHVLKC